ncbi:DUF4383 domain-containing protein [Streptomyces nojiriensis]|uniref:DUF4383 domain-containing protein n=1 Tax=Streptomyces nojiriensis TaxID=66374 RepID=UPI00364A7352
MNGLHNLVHFTIDVMMITAAARGVGAAKQANTAIGLLYVALGAFGLFLADAAANFLAINAADNALHLGLGGAIAVIGLRTDRALAGRAPRVSP